MLNTTLHYKIFKDFTRNPPQQVPLGSSEENKAYLSFWEYLESGSNINLIGNPGKNDILLTKLVTGRKGTSINLHSSFKKPHKCIFPKKQDIQTVFFLDEKLESEKNKYRSKNGYLFGFIDDYKQVWKDLALIEKPEVLPVRKDTEVNFSSWSKLSEYILPYTDLIIVDNYMFEDSISVYNLIRIIEEFSKKTPVKFNLLLISFKHDKQLFNIKDYYSNISKLLNDKEIKCDLSIVLANQSIKEHDRGIFNNYLRIKSGDSFTFFDKNEKFLTKGTDIDFHSMVKRDKFNASNAALKNINRIVNILRDPIYKEKRLIGNLDNGLLNFK